MTAGYDVQRLQTAQQAQLERLVGRVSRTSPYVGRVSQGETLRRAEAAHANVSLGLFDGSTLAGYILAVAENARESLRTIGVQIVPDDLPLATVFVVDCAVAPRDRAAAGKLLFRFAQMLRERDDLRQLPLCIACPSDQAARLTQRPAFFRRLGFRLRHQSLIDETARADALHALVLERQPEPIRDRPRAVSDALRSIRTYASSDGQLDVGVVQTTTDWPLLEAYWNRLLTLTPGATVFQTYEYQRTWWAHLGTASDLWIVVALRNGAPVAIAPLQISLLRWLGDDLRCLSFIGNAPESDRPRVLVANPSGEQMLALAAYIVSRATSWDHLFLAEQHPTDAFLTVLTQQLPSAGYSVLRKTGLACPIVSLNTTWSEFLSGKTRAVRKSIKRRNSKLAEAGKSSFENIEPHESPQPHFDRYLAVERASWKSGTTVGVAASSALVAFYRSLLDQFAAAGQVQFHFLSLDDRTIAATFGLVWNGCFYSLHVAHDEAFAKLSPGVVLTGMELQDAFERRSYATFDFLSGTPANKTSWATASLLSVDLLCTRGAIRGRLFHLIYFRMKPRLKAMLIRWQLLRWVKRLKSSLGARADDKVEDED